MARILAMDPPSADLRSALVNTLRLADEAVVLPQAHRSVESGAFKNVVVRLDGEEVGLDPAIFNTNMFTGVSAIRVPAEVAEPLLRDPTKRRAALEALAKAVPSETTSFDLQVGPELDCDEDDRDTAPWVAGFDGASCCVGLYATHEARAPEWGRTGMHRVHQAYYLVCKAGGGVATQTFHSRLVSALQRDHATLDACLASDGWPGAQTLRRAAAASDRNRGRILVLAAQAIGYHAVDTLGDNASQAGGSLYRVAIPAISVNTNTLRYVGEEVGATNDAARRLAASTGSATSVWSYAAGCLDGSSCVGVICASNVAQGFVAFANENGDFDVSIHNQTHNCLPFATPRLVSNKEAVVAAADASKARRASPGADASAHPDGAWIAERFAWLSAVEGAEHIEPPCLWGAFDADTFVGAWGRELGLMRFDTIRMRPEIVAIAGIERAKLKAALQHIDRSKGTREA